MPGAFQAWYPKYTLPLLLSLCGERGSERRQWRATYASKVKERHDLWLTLLPRNTRNETLDAAWTVFQTAFRRWQVPDFPVGWLSLYKQDGSGKEFPGSQSHCFAVHTLGVVWQNIQASALMLDRYSGNAHHLQLRQPWDLFSASASLENLEITQCGPYYPWPNNTTVGKNLGCHLSHCSLWSLIPFHTL